MTVLLYIGLGLVGFIAFLVIAFIIELAIVGFVPRLEVPPQPGKCVGRGDRPEPVGRRDVSFDVEGTTVRAWLYLPDDLSSSVGCVVMAHGLGGTKAALLDTYASRFREAGHAVLAFDYRFLGESDGEPRQLVWIPHQLRDYEVAIAYARGLEEIDGSRIGLWGTSLSGGHVVVLASRDQDIACVTAQCPLLEGDAGGMDALRKIGLGTALRILPHAQRDLVRSWFGLSEHKIPLFGRTNTLAAMPYDDAWSFFEEIAPEGFVNEVCARIAIRMDKYHPVNHAKKVRCPVQLQLCDEDVTTPPSTVEKMEDRLGSLLQVVHNPIDHFDIYQGEHFEKAVTEQIAFFDEHLGS